MKSISPPTGKFSASGHSSSRALYDGSLAGALHPALPAAVALPAAPLHAGGVALRVAGDRQDPVADADRVRGAPALPRVPGAVVHAPRGAETGAVELVDACGLAPVLQRRRARRMPVRRRAPSAGTAPRTDRPPICTCRHRHAQRRQQPVHRPVALGRRAADAAGRRPAGPRRPGPHRRSGPARAARPPPPPAVSVHLVSRPMGLPSRRRIQATGTLGGDGYSGRSSNTPVRRKTTRTGRPQRTGCDAFTSRGRRTAARRAARPR